MNRLALRVAAFALLASSARAHDFWIEPTPARVAPGEPLAAALRVGMACPGDPVPRKPERIERFELVGPPDGAAPVPVTGESGAEPAGRVTPSHAGLHTLVYRGKPVFIELTAAQFESYLREEGLDSVIELRRARGHSGLPGREVYSRCAKALVAVGAVPEDAGDRSMGLRYELIVESNPLPIAPARAGDEAATLVVRAEFEGKPLTGAQIKAVHCAGTGGAEQSPPIRTFRTDADGRAKVTIDAPGRWVLASTEMREAPAGSGADWESVWASLVIEAAAAPISKP